VESAKVACLRSSVWFVGYSEAVASGFRMAVIRELTKPFLLLYKALLKGFWTMSSV
jgi:hypothetical protein